MCLGWWVVVLLLVVLVWCCCCYRYSWPYWCGWWVGLGGELVCARVLLHAQSVTLLSWTALRAVASSAEGGGPPRAHLARAHLVPRRERQPAPRGTWLLTFVRADDAVWGFAVMTPASLIE